MNGPSSIAHQIHDYVGTNFLFDLTEVSYEDSLLEQGVLDSTAVLELVMFVEETFGVAVLEHEVVPENFDSINALAAFVQDKLSQLQTDIAS